MKMSRTTRQIKDLQQRYNNDNSVNDSDRFNKWASDMQNFERELNKKQCPRCQSLYVLQPISMSEFVCTKCGFIGFIRGLLNGILK